MIESSSVQLSPPVHVPAHNELEHNLGHSRSEHVLILRHNERFVRGMFDVGGFFKNLRLAAISDKIF